MQCFVKHHFLSVLSKERQLSADLGYLLTQEVLTKTVWQLPKDAEGGKHVGGLPLVEPSWHLLSEELQRFCFK